MGFGELRNLEARLNRLQGDLKSYNDQLKKAKKRKSQVEDIISSMKKVCENDSSDVNTYLNKLAESFEAAIKGVRNDSGYKVQRNRENRIGTDDNMTSSYSMITSELQDIDNRISDLQNKINRTNQQIAECQREIQREKSRIASSFRDALINARNKLFRAEKAYEANPTDAYLKREYEKAVQKKNQATRDYNNYAGWL